jgi:hypothetical protein
VEKTTYERASCSILLIKYNSGYKINKPKKGGACSTYGEVEMRTGF